MASSADARGSRRPMGRAHRVFEQTPPSLASDPDYSAYSSYFRQQSIQVLRPREEATNLKSWQPGSHALARTDYLLVVCGTIAPPPLPPPPPPVCLPAAG
eukprot:scaffold12135_cov97-Isochrysis_galbana.AAC.1